MGRRDLVQALQQVRRPPDLAGEAACVELVDVPAVAVQRQQVVRPGNEGDARYALLVQGGPDTEERHGCRRQQLGAGEVGRLERLDRGLEDRRLRMEDRAELDLTGRVVSPYVVVPLL